MKNYVTFAVICFVPTLAFGQVADMPPPSIPDKTIELTYEEILLVQQGLASLDGYQKIVEEGGKTKAVAQPYDLSEDTREAIADDEVVLKPIVEGEQSAQKAFTKSLGPYPKADSPEAKKWDQEVTDNFERALKKKFKVLVTLLTRTELKPGPNNLPPSVLAALDPITKRK